VAEIMFIVYWRFAHGLKHGVALSTYNLYAGPMTSSASRPTSSSSFQSPLRPCPTSPSWTFIYPAANLSVTTPSWDKSSALASVRPAGQRSPTLFDATPASVWPFIDYLDFSPSRSGRRLDIATVPRRLQYLGPDVWLHTPTTPLPFKSSRRHDV